MNLYTIKRQFERIGARAKVDINSRRFGGTVSIDVGNDGKGEFFDIDISQDDASDLRVVDSQPRIRHLLLLSEQSDGKHKFLCGHDERHWFVAAVPERASVTNVRTAFEVLKPEAVHLRQNELNVKPRKRNRRRNVAFIRQGEWFFVPLPTDQPIDEKLIFRNEPLRRRRGKPHHCQELVRQGGELVYVSPQHPNGLTEVQFGKLMNRKPKLRHLPWLAQRRNPGVFVRGKVRHADHKTIVLDGWHQVLMNTETESVAMRHVAFID